jgi:hypothetical protein
MVARRFADISEDLEGLLIKKVRNERFSIHIDEATDCCDIGNLIDYVRFVEDTTIIEDTFFYKPIKRSVRAKELLEIVDAIIRKKEHKIVILCWSNGCSSHNDEK